MSATDPMHPNGRCACDGEGRCPWCVRVRADERVEEALDALREANAALAAAREARTDALAAVRAAEKIRRMAVYHAHESARRRVR